MSAGGELRLRGMFRTGFVTFHWQDDGSMDEQILETMRMSVLDLDEVKNILETKIREYNQQSKSFESMKTLCNNFNKIFETLFSLWKGTHRLHELHQFPSLNFLEHVMKRCYKKCVRNASSSLQVFDKKTFLMIDAVFKHFQLTEDDVVTDINAGSGSVVLQVSASGSFKCCYGIVPKNDRTSEYEHLSLEFTKWMEFYGKDYTEFQLFHEDLTSNDMLKLISETTVIFLKDLNVEADMENKILSVFSQLNETCRIISLENCSQLFAFRDRRVDVKECKTGQSDVRYFLHLIKTRSVENLTQAEPQSLPSSVADVQKNQQRPLEPSPPISSTQNVFKAPGIVKDADKVLPSAETPASLTASLDNILSCYRNQFIKFIEFMQTKEYRLQLGESVKEELLNKTKLKNKIESLLLQINELNSSSLGTPLQAAPGIGTNSSGDVLAEVRSLVTYNRQLKILESLLKNEISQLERREIVQDDLSELNEKSLLRKASDCYEKYIQLKEKVKSLEAEVATLECKKENRQGGSTGPSFSENSACKSIPTEARQFPVDFVTGASGTWSTTSSPRKNSHSEEHSGVVPFSRTRTSVGLSFQSPIDIDTSFSYPPAVRLHCPSTPGDSSNIQNDGSDGRMEDFRTPLNNGQCSGFAGIGSNALANRRGSSSSTDTAESGQDPKYSTQNFEGNSISSWPNSPGHHQPEVSRYPGQTSKSQALRSAMEGYGKPLVQSTTVRVPHMFPLTQSEEMGILSQTTPEVVPAAGRGKMASGKRGRRKRSAHDTVDDSKGKAVSFSGKRGKLADLTSTAADTGWRALASEARGNEMRQIRMLEGQDLLSLGLHQRPEEHGYAKPLKSNGKRTTKTDARKAAQDAGNLDALLMAVSLHHLPPSHRNLGQDMAQLTTKIPPQILRQKLMHATEHFSSAPFLPLQLSSSSFLGSTGKPPITTLSWSLPQVSNSKPCAPGPDVLRTESSTHLTNDKQVETLDDSHGKHFKKRCHSKSVKHNRAKKTGSTADPLSPSPTNEATTTMPILKSLFSKRNENVNLAPIIQHDKSEFDNRSMQLPTDSPLMTTRSNSIQISSAAHPALTTGMSTINQTSNAAIPNLEMSRYMNVSSPSGPLKQQQQQQFQGVSWFSLPLSLLRQIQMAPRQSDASLTAERQPSEPDELMSQSAPTFTSVSSQRTVLSSLASSVAPSPGTVELRDDPYKSVAKSLS